MRNINWHEASRYCAWLTVTLRNSPETPPLLATKLQAGWQIMLPSEAEWERTARSLDGRIYPWGDKPVDPNRANYQETGIGDTSAVGCFPAGATPEGVEELSGNIWEWTRSRYLAYPYPSVEQERRERELLTAKDDNWMTVRGGAFRNGEQNMRAPARGGGRADDLFDDGDGFRVVVGAAPRRSPQALPGAWARILRRLRLTWYGASAGATASWPCFSHSPYAFSA